MVRGFRFRLALAMMMAAGFAVSTAEALIPEYHDGDAAAVAAGGAGQMNGPAESNPAPRHQPGQTHVCHCVHPPAVGMIESGLTSLVPGHRLLLPPAADSAPPCRVVPPQLRPPIA